MSVPIPADAAQKDAPPAIDPPRAAHHDEGGDALRIGLGIASGFALLAIVDAAAISRLIPLPHGGLALRAWHQAFAAAETLGVGALAGALAALWTSRARLPWLGSVAVEAAITTPIVYVLIGSDIFRQASVSLDGRFESALFAVYVIAAGLGVAVLHHLAVVLAHGKITRWILFVVGLAGMIADHLFLDDDYYAVHGVAAWAAAILAGSAVAPVVTRLARSAMKRPMGRVAAIALGLVAALGLVIPPPNRVRFELFRNCCAVAPWVLASTLWRPPRVSAPPGPAIAPAWLADRSAAPSVAPTRPPLFPRNPVVVLITVDATRADAIGDAANDRLFPTLTEMKRVGAHFTRATSPGSQTAVSLTTTFSGRYFSELYWAMHGTGVTRFAYAADDPTVRFPELLTEAGVKTSIFCSVNFLAGDFGVARGFDEQRVIPEGRKHAYARQMIDPVLERLKRQGGEPLFLYVHLMEPHSPYDRGRRDGTMKERYLSEIAIADAQIGRVWRMLAQRFPDRGVLFVAADHGEAFGEHQTQQHTKTLYEELLRVPLLVRGPNVVHTRIDARVGLVDLGPTMLDLFGVATPGAYMGQSLVPFLAGRGRTLERPILAEGRLRHALYTPDGLKVIDDPRRRVVEVYDLAKDPGELDDIFDRDRARSEPAVAALRAFFAAHELKRPGYSPVYKP